MKLKFAIRHLICVFLLTLSLPMAVQAQNIPEVPPPTRVDGSSGGSYQAPPPRPCTNVTRTVRAPCGTEKVCQELKGRGMLCWTQEKYCDKSITSCN